MSSELRSIDGASSWARRRKILTLTSMAAVSFLIAGFSFRLDPKSVSQVAGENQELRPAVL